MRECSLAPPAPGLPPGKLPRDVLARPRSLANPAPAGPRGPSLLPWNIRPLCGSFFISRGISRGAAADPNVASFGTPDARPFGPAPFKASPAPFLDFTELDGEFKASGRAMALASLPSRDALLPGSWPAFAVVVMAG